MKKLMKISVWMWEFVVGEDWRTVLGVIITLGTVAALAAGGISAWWLMPPAVLALLALSLRRAIAG